jgi:hypothetical protein
VNLVLRRMMYEAATNGYDYVAWATGKQNAGHYSLRRQLEWLEAKKIELPETASSLVIHGATYHNGTYLLHVEKPGLKHEDGRQQYDDLALSSEELRELVGDEVANNIEEFAGQRNFYKRETLSNVPLHTKRIELKP